MTMLHRGSIVRRQAVADRAAGQPRCSTEPLPAQLAQEDIPIVDGVCWWLSLQGEEMQLSACLKGCPPQPPLHDHECGRAPGEAAADSSQLCRLTSLPQPLQTSA
ncbi:hypothetical protein SVAN01_10792 [Stagonosporopsis vannaccii]|nr:hypothetical protein SVAN01_10792 [Stagonosporopsis vannaccii]